MKTNREKYDHYCGLIAAKDQSAISELLPSGTPACFHIIEKYEAKPVLVTKVVRYRRGFYVKDADARITKKDIEQVVAIHDGWTAPVLDDIMVHYSNANAWGAVSGAYPYPDIGGKFGLAWDAAALAPEIERRRDLYAERDGHKPCTYCRKQVPEESMVSHTIHYRDRGGLAKKTCLYCSATCGSYDQMGHEG